MRREIEAVAFDLDGTLYPNYRLNVKLIPFVLREFCLLLAFDRARKIIRRKQGGPCGLPLSDFYRQQALLTAKILRMPPAQASEKIGLIYRECEPFFTSIKLFPQVAQTLESLREAGLKLGLLSDFPPETKLQNMGLTGIWDAVLCSERTGALKPHGRPFLELAASLALPPEKILYVGNSLSYDVAGASHAGMKTAWIKSPLALPGSNKQPIPDFCFHDYRQLRDYVLSY